MSEEIRKNGQDAKLNPEELEKVAGGYIIHNDDDYNYPIYCDICGAQCVKDGQGNYRCPNGPHYEKPKCPYCGSEKIEYIPQAHMTICLDCEREF